MYQIFALVAAFLLSVVSFGPAIAGMETCSEAESLDPQVVKVGVRGDALPFSSGSATDGYDGYMVELCEQFLNRFARRPYCAVEVVPEDRLPDDTAVAPESVPPGRFTALKTGKIDMMCGATTVTLAVDHEFRASLFTFLSATAFVYRDDLVRAATGPINVGYRKGTTSDPSRMGGRPGARAARTAEDAIRGRFAAAGSVNWIEIDSHRDAIGCLLAAGSSVPAECKTAPLHAYVADRPILQGLLPEAQDRMAAALLTARDARDAASRSSQAARTEVRKAEEQAENTGGAATADEGAVAAAETAQKVLKETEDAFRAVESTSIRLDNEALVLQPYAVIFPASGDARAGLEDMAFAFNRFLVEEKFASGERGRSPFLEFRKDLLRHFRAEVDVSYLRLAEMQGWIPVGVLPQ